MEEGSVAGVASVKIAVATLTSVQIVILAAKLRSGGYLVSDLLVVGQSGVDRRCPLRVPDPLSGRISPSSEGDSHHASWEEGTTRTTARAQSCSALVSASVKHSVPPCIYPVN